MQLLTLIATGATVLASLRTVQGHGYIMDPKPYFKQGYPSNGYGSTINNTRWAEFDGATTNDYTQTNVVFFKCAFESTKEKSMAAFVARYQELYSNEIDPTCGLTSYKESERSELPATELTYSGFTHPGPCCVLCGITQVLCEDDCQQKYPAIPAKIPYDKSKCANADLLIIIWIAVQSNPWQVYSNCAWLVGGSGRGEVPLALGKGSPTPAAGSSPTPTTNTAPLKTGATPKAAGDAYAFDDDEKKNAPTPDPTPDDPTPDPTPADPTPDPSTDDPPTPDPSPADPNLFPSSDELASTPTLNAPTR